MSLRVQSPIIIDNYNLALDLSANYHFTGSDYRVDASNIYLTNLRDGSNGHSNIVVYDASTGRLSYTSTGGGTGITQVLSGTNIDVMFGSTIPVVNLEITSPVDCSGQPLYDVSNVDFRSDINISNAGQSYIFTDSGDLWVTAGLNKMYLNASVFDCQSTSIENVNDLSAQSVTTQTVTTQDISAQDISAQNISVAQTISAQTVTTQNINAQDISAQNITVAQDISAQNVYTNTVNPRTGSVLTLDGSTINIGNVSSIVNLFGTVNKIETTNVEITDQLITLNKNGTTASSLGSGFEIEASGGIVGYIKTDTTNGSSFLVKVPASSTVYKMVLADASGYIDISGTKGGIDISGTANIKGTANITGNTSITGSTHIGGAFDVSGATVLSGNASIAGNTHIGGTFDVSGATTLSGNTSIAGSTHIGGAFDVSGATILTGNTHIGGAFDVSGATSVAGNTVLTGNTHIGGAFDVSGATVLSGNANIAGATSITGNAHVGGAFDVSGTSIFSGTATFNSTTDFNSTTNVNGTIKLNSLVYTNKTALLNIDPITDIVSYETHPTYTQPLSVDASNVVSIPQASASTNGYLASGDWTHFNTLLSNISATAPLTFINNVINISNVDLSGTNGYLSSTQYQNITNSIIAAAGTIMSQVYYVAMNGNDASGTGSVMSPFATIQKAINLCTDTSKYYTIYLAPYAYTESPTIGASISPRISIIGLTNNTNSKNVTVTGSFTIAASVATGNETNNVVAFKNLTIQTATGNAINLTGQGFSLFVNNCNLAVSGTNTASVVNLASSSATTRYYFDNVRINNVAVASSNPMVNLATGQIWSITNSDFTSSNTSGNQPVIYSNSNNGQLLTVANSSFTNTYYGTVFSLQCNPSSCSLSNSTFIGYNTDASSGLLVFGNGVAAGSGGSFSVANSILYNTNSATSSNTYIFLNGGATLISSSNTFYSPNTGATAFTPFGYKVTKVNNIVRYTNSAYISGNVAGTNTVTYPSVSAGIIAIENALNDTDNLTNFNNATIKFNALPLTATDASLVTFNPTTKQIAYRSIPTAIAGTNIGIASAGAGSNPTISVAITSTLDMSNQGIIGISYERFAGEINIQNSAQVPIIYTTGNTANLLLNPSGGSGVINTTGHNIDMSNASIVGIASEIFTTNISLEANGVPVIYTTGTATDIVLHPSVVGGVVKINNGHSLDMTGGSIINAGDIISKSSTDLALIAGNGGSHILLKTGNTPITRMEIDNATIRAYLPLDMSNNYITNASYLNFATGNGNGNISIQQNGVPRIYTQSNNLIIDPSTNGALQFGGAHTFDLCGGRIATATSLTGVADTSLSIQYSGATSGSLYLQSATNPTTNKKMVLDNSGIHISGTTGIFDISGITSNVVIDASGNLNMDGGSSTYNFKVAGQTGNMYVGGTVDISGVTTIAPIGGNGNKFVVDTTGTHSSGGVLDASGSVYKNTLSDASGNVYINGVALFTNEVDMCANTIKMNLPDGSSNAYYVSYDFTGGNTKKLGYKKNVTASSPLLLDGNNNLTYDFTANATYNNATTQINSTSLIGLSGGVIDICGVTAINISGPTNMNGSITSAAASRNVWNGTNYFAGDVSINNTNTLIRSTSLIGLSSDIIDFSGVTAINISGPTTINGATTMNGNLTSTASSHNVWNGTNYYAGDVSFNAGAYFRNATVAMTALSQSTQNNILNINTATGALSYDTSYNVAKAILSTANTWSQTQTFGSNIYMNSNLIYLQNNTNFTIGMYDSSHVGLGYNGVYNFNFDNQGNTASEGNGAFYVSNTGGIIMGNAISPYISITQTTIDFYASGNGNNYITWDSGTNSLAVSGYNGGFLQGTNGGAKKALVWDSSANVGIGKNTSSSYQLDVSGITHTNNKILVNDATAVSTGTPMVIKTASTPYTNAETQGTGLQLYTGTTSSTDMTLYMGCDTTNQVSYIQSILWGASFNPLILNGKGGNVGIAKGNPSYALDVSGDIQVNQSIRYINSASAKYFTFQTNNTGSIVLLDQSGTGVFLTSGNTSWSGTSDIRLKTNIQSIDCSASYNNMLNLNPVYYNFINEASGNKLRGGLIAQEVLPYFPDIISMNGDYYGISYTEFIPHLISSIKEQAKIIKGDKERIALLEQNVDTLTSQVASLSSDMMTLKQMFNL